MSHDSAGTSSSTASNAKSKELNQYGFDKSDKVDEGEYEKFVEGYLPVLERRQKRWQQMAFGGDGQKPQGMLDKNKLKRFVRKGIPPEIRAEQWMFLSGAKELMRGNEDEYGRLCSMQCAPEVEDIIELDLRRTYPDNEFFRTANAGSLQNDLRIVLSAFANKNPHIGYCQGLNFIAGMCLLILDDMEKAFWLLHTTIQNLPDYYSPGMPGLRADMGVLNDLIAQEFPDISKVFKRLDFDPAMLVTKWFVCWFLETLPIETVLRVWDCFFSEGAKILFRCALTLIGLNKAKFLKCQHFGHVADVFKEIVADSKVIQCHSFMKDLFEVSGSMPSKTIDNLRQKHQKLIAEQEAQRAQAR